MHYAKYGELYRKRSQEYRTKLRTEFRTNMLDYLKDKKGILCGEDDIRVLEFDHIDPSKKSFGISQSVRLGYRWPDVELEIKNAESYARTAIKSIQRVKQMV